MDRHGCLVVSLDFEMMWGCHDWATPIDYGKSNVSEVRSVIVKLLELFERYEIHATFATVGLLFCKNNEDALKHLPLMLPSYSDQNLGPFKSDYIKHINDKDAHLYYALDIIEKLKRCPYVEIGSHTFSHYFCQEEGQTIDEFRADLAEMHKITAEHDIKLTSIVFPKNQVSDDYLEACADWGLKYYRGNALKYFSIPNSKIEAVKNRICRLVDAYINIGGNTSYPYEKVVKSGGLLNIPASRFIRPYSSKLSFLERIRLHRIKKEIHYAAKHNEIYHIWWHPHNCGANFVNNICFIEEIFKCYAECHHEYGMLSYTMRDIADLLLNNKK